MISNVFLSYVHENSAIVDRLATDLETAGVAVWLDRSRLGPGEWWRDEIQATIRRSQLFIACFSREFAARDRSHMNEELTLAIEELRLRPPGQIWFIPVLIDDSDVPDLTVSASRSLRDLQRVDLTRDWASGVANIAQLALRGQTKTTHPSDERPAINNLHGDNSRGTHTDTDVGQVPSQPDLRLTYALQRGISGYRDISYAEIRVLLTVTNHATSPAVAPCIRIEVPQSFSIQRSGISSGQGDSPLQVTSEPGQPPVSVFTARNDYQIYPSIPLHFAQACTEVNGNVAVPSCDIHFRTAAINVKAGTGVLRVGAEKIAAFLGRSVEPTER